MLQHLLQKFTNFVWHVFFSWEKGHETRDVHVMILFGPGVLGSADISADKDVLIVNQLT